MFAVASVTRRLADLGVSHLYLSPFLQSAPGTSHGYAVVDHSRVDRRLGGEEGREAMAKAALDRGLGIVIDLVPNHMAISLPSNRWFWDVLEHGPASRYADHFDVDWDPPDSAIQNKVLLPVLADHYGRELEAGALHLRMERGRFTVHYHDQVFPASPRSIGLLLEEAANRSGSDELSFAARSLQGIPPPTSTDPASRDRRHADAGVVYDFVAELAARPLLEKAIVGAMEHITSDPDLFDDFLEEQNYRLSRWRVAEQELGYRRFFDIDDLIGLRVEIPSVFADSHHLVLEWVEAGEADGLRIDHPDGLRSPGAYLSRLREAAPEAWIVVEKILAEDESLPGDWPVDGTTGYEFLNDVTALLVDAAAEDAFTALWQEFSESNLAWGEVAEQAKRDVLRDVLAADVNRLTAVFADLTQSRRRYRDFTRIELVDALREMLVGFDVYRTYVPEDGGAGPVDRQRIRAAVERAQSADPEIDPELLGLLQTVLTGEKDGPVERELKMRFQQLTGPVMAKGVEDTAFYRYLRLAALCEVGGNPGRFGLTEPDELHRRWARTGERWPHRMLSLTTHDAKRSEDVRARLAVLTEIPDRWADTVRAWRERNEQVRPDRVDGATEYLIYQTLVGAHPIGADRLVPYLEKATKEAKVHTSWTDPDPDYDEAIASFARSLLADRRQRQEIEAFVALILPAGHVNGLTQKVIQLTAPGVPDIYQGTELWDLSLVDPDNRRPVDHRLLERLAGELEELDASSALGRTEDGTVKMWVVSRLLDLRKRRSPAFESSHRPLPTVGDAGDHAFAYQRGVHVCVVVPRLTLRLQERGGWGDTSLQLPGGDWADVFTGSRHTGDTPLASLLSEFPVAVLERI